jgi:hypothetical protein
MKILTYFSNVRKLDINITITFEFLSESCFNLLLSFFELSLETLNLFNIVDIIEEITFFIIIIIFFFFFC